MERLLWRQNGKVRTTHSCLFSLQFPETWPSNSKLQSWTLFQIRKIFVQNGKMWDYLDTVLPVLLLGPFGHSPFCFSFCNPQISKVNLMKCFLFSLRPWAEAIAIFHLMISSSILDAWPVSAKCCFQPLMPLWKNQFGRCSRCSRLIFSFVHTLEL